MDVWLGGIAASELRRVGRLADGWLPSFVTPAEAAAGRATVEHVAAEHGRQIPDDHFGVLIPYAFEPPPTDALERLIKRRPGVDPAALVPVGWDALVTLVREFIDVGTSKFVIAPLAEPADWHTHLGEAAEALLPLET